MKVIGIRPSSFTGEDKTQISGRNIYLTYPLEKGEGLGSERIFLTDAKLNAWAYQPKVGDEVNVSYPRFLALPFSIRFLLVRRRKIPLSM